MTADTVLDHTAERSSKKALKISKEKMKKNVSGENASDTTKKVSDEAFTPSVLNNQVTAMRQLVKSAKHKIIQKMNHQVKKMQIITEKNQSEKMKKQVDKLKKDIAAVQTIDKDEVSKFALVNKETLDKLLNKPDLSSSERALFKVAMSPSLDANVKAFRLRYPDCNASCAFMLQRLGLQYKARKGEKVGDKLKKQLKSGETINVDLAMASGGKEDEGKKADSSPIKKKENEKVVWKGMAKSKEESKKSIDKNKKGEEIAETPVKVKPIEIVKGTASKQAVVKKINLQGGDSDDEENDTDVEMESDEASEVEESEDEGEKSEDEGENDDDEKGDGLSAFFLNSDGTSRDVVTGDMKDVDEEEEEEKGRGMMRGRGRGMRGNGELQRSTNWGRGGGDNVRGISETRGDMKKGMNRGGRGDRRGRGEMRGGRGEMRRGRGDMRGGRGENRVTDGVRSSATSEVLHPSWIAKQKQKEIMKAGPSGKKITFD